ncbi:hypothetical protein Ocin01_08230 [Orchesella cincta]|uniref:Uncharacterized protein n=1 Tax=Orchesella cincta TaxID=48709 RepID=A0A1D2MZJ2_ORCCI|nr:hypothetical protein Ocin01_08230 [Orchesella cincta]
MGLDRLFGTTMKEIIALLSFLFLVSFAIIVAMIYLGEADGPIPIKNGQCDLRDKAFRSVAA